MVRPSPRTLVVIQTDPTKSHRAVEALRIALGLGSHNEGKDISIILTGRAHFLLSENTDDSVDGKIIEKHLTVFIEWVCPFSICTDPELTPSYMQDGVTRHTSTSDI